MRYLVRVFKITETDGRMVAEDLGGREKCRGTLLATELQFCRTKKF